MAPRAPSPKLSVDVRPPRLVPAAEVKLLVKELKLAMAAGGEARAEMTLSLVVDEEIADLNRQWRGDDKPTDVLSFSMREGEGGDLHPDQLGDVIISVETARRQADAAGRPLHDELLHLAVHGFAHLCGYDHATLDEERVMFAWEAGLRAAAVATKK